MAQSKGQSGASRTRQADIAKAAGVSQATVSMVLSGRNPTRISEETRQRILGLSGSLGYSANPAARSLAGGKNRILGVFTYEPTFPIAGLDQYYPFLLGIESEAERLQQNLLLFTSASSGGAGSRRSIYADGVNQLGIADGSILLGRGEDRDEVARLANEGYPFVYIGRREIPDAQISWVTADYASATYDVMTRLIEHGHRSFVYVGVAVPEEPNLDRFTGWQRSLDEHGLTGVVDRSGEGGELEAVLHTEIDAGATAVIVETPENGARVFRLLKKLGLEVPGDVSVAVLGDMAIPRGRKQSWSGFDMPFGDIGAEAVQLLVQLISDRATGPSTVKLPCLPRPGRTIARPRTRG